MSAPHRRALTIAVAVAVASGLPGCGSCAKSDASAEADPAANGAQAADGTEPTGSARRPRIHWDGGRHRFRRIGHPPDGSAPPAPGSSDPAPP